MNAPQNKNYTLPQKDLWTGRKTNPKAGKQYWYQQIELTDINNLTSLEKKTDIGLLGYACEEGVRRNQGRVGAKSGPDTLRQRLGKYAYHHKSKSVADFGNIVCEESEMETAQNELSKAVTAMLSNAVFPIVVGGGHDISYGHFKGIWNAVKDTDKSKIGIINFDAHFDLRPVEEAPNSGTPFNQILSEHGDNVNYLALGIQQHANTEELFDIAEQHNVTYLFNHECVEANFEAVKSRLASFIEQNDYLYITIDMDGFSSAYASGVSAPSPMGFTPFFVLNTLRYLFDSQKVISCDIAEFSPKFDKDNTTASLVASLVDFVVGVR